MNDEILHERVMVVTVFAPGLNPCRPIKFKRHNGREIMITEIGLVHPKNDGIKTRHVFDVTDGAADYRLEFDSLTLTWYLTFIGDRYNL
ncbi:hypothetical protein FWF48_01635 [Candidatus Saccharibacteria bacterium]|nr:hypothetical protein [Candidatus Saccharibacteria bacterium]